MNLFFVRGCIFVFILIFSNPVYARLSIETGLGVAAPMDHPASMKVSCIDSGSMMNPNNVHAMNN